jgi:hypothetical protein
VRIGAEKHRLGVRSADLSGSVFDDVGLSGLCFHDMAIDGVAVTDLLAYWQAGHGAKGA